ncbi:unnamed protein product [Arabidopsis halleri]
MKGGSHGICEIRRSRNGNIDEGVICGLMNDFGFELCDYK